VQPHENTKTREISEGNFKSTIALSAGGEESDSKPLQLQDPVLTKQLCHIADTYSCRTTQETASRMHYFYAVLNQA
jgi:hypothetical protein